MGPYGYRLTYDESRRIKEDFSWGAYYFARIYGFVFSIILIYGIIKIIFQILVFPFRHLFSKRKEVYVTNIFIDPKLGAAWYWWTYVTFMIGEKEKTFKLTPGQAVDFVIREDIREGDAGELSFFRNRINHWNPEFKTRDKKAVVFLSYSHQDKAVAGFIEKVLTNRGIKPWRDKDKLLPGDRLPKEIEHAILHADAFLPLLSNEYLASKWCEKELEYACNQIPDKVFPINISNEDLFIPGFIQVLLDEAGEPVFFDLDSKKGLELLRDRLDYIRELKQGTLGSEYGIKEEDFV